jgi:hypothetical protein
VPGIEAWTYDQGGNLHAPIVLIVFNRPHLTSQLYERVRAARPRDLIIVADGPRPNHPDDPKLCEAVRKIVGSPDWECKLRPLFQEVNVGCRAGISSGLNWVFHQISRGDHSGG